ncbi:MAG: NAD(P)H-dependent glycerol-3-phosphate dehydrogenase [Oscillospiraceae bacterium]|nr:NAD(P)H-dependent glycerol-3-phosphate dehydrogenase [Oscillospiraceae bacterium]
MEKMIPEAAVKAAVVGAGAWGTALALVLNRNKIKTSLWSHNAADTQRMMQTRENPRLPGVMLPESIRPTTDLACVRECAVVVAAVPSFAMRETAAKLAPLLSPGTVLISAAKGIEDGTGKRMSELLGEQTGAPIAVLSGPSHAEEVSRGIPTGVVAASEFKEAAELAQSLFMNDSFRVYTSPDVVGVELGAAHKNIIALCAGISDGLGNGDNAKALLMTRGLEETARLGLRLGARRETFAGLAGMGDLIVTCTSMHSRNRRAGILIGQGVDVEAALKEIGAVVEGYYAVRAAVQLADRFRMEMPITRAAYAILYGGAQPVTVIQQLMRRSGKSELEYAEWAR